MRNVLAVVLVVFFVSVAAQVQAIMDHEISDLLEYSLAKGTLPSDISPQDASRIVNGEFWQDFKPEFQRAFWVIANQDKVDPFFAAKGPYKLEPDSISLGEAKVNMKAIPEGWFVGINEKDGRLLLAQSAEDGVMGGNNMLGNGIIIDKGTFFSQTEEGHLYFYPSKGGDVVFELASEEGESLMKIKASGPVMLVSSDPSEDKCNTDASCIQYDLDSGGLTIINQESLAETGEERVIRADLKNAPNYLKLLTRGGGPVVVTMPDANGNLALVEIDIHGRPKLIGGPLAQGITITTEGGTYDELPNLFRMEPNGEVTNIGKNGYNYGTSTKYALSQLGDVFATIADALGFGRR